MPWMCSRFLVALTCFGMVVLLPGCTKSYGWGVSAGVLDSGCWVEQLRCDGRVFVVLAANGSSTGASASSGDGSFSGEIVTIDARKIAWSCRSSDGTRGSVTIDGQDFDLGNGAVFLVRTKEAKTKVQQHSVEMSKLQNPLPPDRPLQAWGKVEARIAEFVKEAESKP